MICFLSAILVRIQHNPDNINNMDSLRQSLANIMSRLIESNLLHLEVIDVEAILNALLLNLAGR